MRHVLAMCLATEITALAAWLQSAFRHTGRLRAGGLRLPGVEQDGVEACMRAWIGHIHQLTDRARAQQAVCAEEAGGVVGHDVATVGSCF
ncbi:hypothetical protein ACH4TQ_49685 [Streptomyces sp. NPDC021218]|uniref:hypothetical protein n=1 Tax=Streptomyces sp. NPDC021218 TaxID=3365119 RepID=UPI0037954214